MSNHHHILTLLVMLLSMTGLNAQINTDQVIRVGQNALYFEDYMLSIQYFNQAIRAKPYLAQPYFLRAIAKINLEDYAGAEDDASKAIELNPFITDAWEARGVARQNMGRNREAIADYEHALELLPRNRQLMFNKAMAQVETGDTIGADTTFNRLLEFFPAFDNGYLGRARLRLAMTDTVGARADIDKALELNKNAVNAYIMRADIAIHSARDYAAARADMDEAVRLQPRMAGLYINRAFLRYNLNDYFGAMADYDYALQLDPINSTALFNRGLLLAEVNANDRALEDFTKVLDLNPDDYRALFNRAVVLNRKHDFKGAIADIDRIIEHYPDFPGGYYVRYEINRARGDMRQAERDFNRANALARAARPADADVAASGAAATGKQGAAEGREGDSDSQDAAAELTSRRFASLLTLDNNADIREEYNNSAIRGRVQNRDIQIETEPMMELSYYTSPTELRQNSYYIKEVDDINSTRQLRRVINVTNRAPGLTDDAMIKQHFESIEYFNSYLSTHQPRAIDYIGRAMDFVTIRNYPAALADVARAIALTPDNPVAYLLRAQIRKRSLQADRGDAMSPSGKAPDASARAMVERKALDDIRADLDKVTELSPRMAVAWFNKGNVLIDLQDLTSAISAFSRAIELKPDMGEAYYNRGYLYLKLGNQAAGVADLSKAGELGIIPAYNLIKRISQ